MASHTWNKIAIIEEFGKYLRNGVQIILRTFSIMERLED
jgi:hypothetical protein